MSASEALG